MAAFSTVVAGGRPGHVLAQPYRVPARARNYPVALRHQVPQPTYLHGTLYPAQYEVLTWLAGLAVALASYALVLRRHRAVVASS